MRKLACAASGATTVATWHTSPAAREGAAMAYDQARGQTVLYGGYRFTGGPAKYDSNLAETWLFDGFNWQRKTPDHSPGYRIGHVVAVDHPPVAQYRGAHHLSALWCSATCSVIAFTTASPARPIN